MTPLRPRRLRAALALGLFALLLQPAPSSLAATPPPGSTWYETYITTPDGQRLHTDVMRPTGLTEADKTPVILIVSPYLGMASRTEQPGPSNRFYDFINGAKVFERGYSVVMVSLRGTGGSSGCLDILGPGEQTDVATAVQWAATQPWSTGRVGMYGKSYDANTGVVGAALQPPGLAAVVAQQITPDRYRGSYNDRVRYLQSLSYPSVSYGAGGEGTFSVNGDEEYIVNSVSHSADCQVFLAEHYAEDESIPFWRVRDFAERAKGSTVPTLMTTGYIDANTNIGGGALDFFNALAGPKRMWIGWWDHVRGNELAGGRLAMGREGWFDEVMRFYDHHVKGVPLSEAPTNLDPVIAAQGSDGTWREEISFPPPDATSLPVTLLSGSYEDDGENEGSLDSAAGPGGGSTLAAKQGHGSWTFTPPLPHAAHVMGIPSASVQLDVQVPRTNVVVNVYDVDPGGKATMITRGAAMADSDGVEQVALYPTDWLLEAGHRIGVLVSGANTEAYVHVPTNTNVTVTSGKVELPFLRYIRTSDLQGEPAPRLETWRTSAPFPVPAATITDRTHPTYEPPPPMEERPA
ncbi:MAG: CocE/NonD family hydrolase [Actinomycetota bacterium]